LFRVKDRLRRAVGDTDLTAFAKVVDANVDGLVMAQGHIRQHCRQAKI
jgi:hypothetical protein